MITQSAGQATSLELMLLEVVRALPSHRALQVLDFARWLQTQLAPEEDKGGHAQVEMEQQETA